MAVYRNPAFSKGLGDLATALMGDPAGMARAAALRSQIGVDNARRDVLAGEAERARNQEHARALMQDEFRAAVEGGGDPRAALGDFVLRAVDLNPQMAQVAAQAIMPALAGTRYGTPGLGEQGMADIQTSTGVQTYGGTQQGVGDQLANALQQVYAQQAGQTARKRMGISAENARHAAEMEAKANAPTVYEEDDVILMPDGRWIDLRGNTAVDPDQVMMPPSAYALPSGDPVAPVPEGVRAAVRQTDATARNTNADAARTALGNEVLRLTGMLPATAVPPSEADLNAAKASGERAGSERTRLGNLAIQESGVLPSNRVDPSVAARNRASAAQTAAETEYLNRTGTLPAKPTTADAEDPAITPSNYNNENIQAMVQGVLNRIEQGLGDDFNTRERVKQHLMTNRVPASRIEAEVRRVLGRPARSPGTFQSPAGVEYTIE